MCGICGIKGLAAKEMKGHVQGMLKGLYHRGPDEEGLYCDDSISLGIRRLSIIDLDTGSQPIYNEDKSLVVVCNGEIYNFQGLREGLLKKNHIFYTNSDVEVLVHLYEEYGLDCLERIKGMFCFALWDRDKKLLFIARDRFGIKPLYYYNKNGRFVFSSEPKSLLKMPFVSKELDMTALDLYFSLEYVPSPYSIYRDIYKLKPAHYIVYKDGTVDIQRYWNIGKTNSNDGISLVEAEERLEGLLCRSVKEHLISDVPLGLFLSGGIDSSVLAGLAKRYCAQRLLTFSMGFKEKAFDESRYASIVSRYLGTRHQAYVFSKGEFIDNFYNLTNALDEPIADLSIFPTYLLSKFTRKHVKVALSGEGADELFMGYPTYRAHAYINLFNKLPYQFKKKFGHLVDLLPASFTYFSLDFKLKQFLKGIYKSSAALRHITWMGAFDEMEKGRLFDKKIIEKQVKSNNNLNDYIATLTHKLDIKDPYRLIQYIDIFTYLSEDLLVKSDRASMLNSLEVRVPYLDHELVEFAWGLDRNMVFQKKILKDISRKFLPKTVINRTKKGFPIPFSMWLKDKEFLGIIERYFTKDLIDRQGIFNHDHIDSLLREHLASKKDNRKKLRTYIMFQMWFYNIFQP